MMLSFSRLRPVASNEIATLELDPISDDTINQSKEILNAVKDDGVAGVLKYAVKFNDLQSDEDNFIFRYKDLEPFFLSITNDERNLLQRTADRIRKFAQCQRDSVKPFETKVDGGTAGQILQPVAVAGCYAPGGRYPLPSSVLMTAITARVAGVRVVVLASPRPSPITLAAAYIAKVDYVLKVGGPQAIGAMAYGLRDLKIPKCQCIVGPGNKWVTAAKKLVSGVNCCIDMLAGPSECLVLADESAKASIVAADLIAQAEHDTHALPILVSNSKNLINEVNLELKNQLENMPSPNREVATEACTKGISVLCNDLEECVRVSTELSPEHFELMVEKNIEQSVWDKLESNEFIGGYGGIFVGECSAEVFGDYGVGPNHVLPTSGTAKYTGGLSVFNFLRIRTYLKLDKTNKQEMETVISDAAAFARLEGLEGHARAAEARTSLFQ